MFPFPNRHFPRIDPGSALDQLIHPSQIIGHIIGHLLKVRAGSRQIAVDYPPM